MNYFFSLIFSYATMTVLSYMIRKQCLNLVSQIDHLYQVFILVPPPLPSWAQGQCLCAELLTF